MRKTIALLMFLLNCSVNFDSSNASSLTAFNFSVTQNDSSERPYNQDTEDPSNSPLDQDTDESEDDEDASKISENWSFSYVPLTVKEVQHEQTIIFENQFQKVNLPPPKA